MAVPPAMRDHTKGLLIGVSAVLSGSVCCVPVRMLGHSNVSPIPHPNAGARGPRRPLSSRQPIRTAGQLPRLLSTLTAAR